MNNLRKNFIFNNKILYFFYKLLKIFKNRKRGWFLSEFAEDELVFRYLQNFKKGIYVDIGCYHPYKGSLTFKLFKIGWQGLNVDLSKVSIDLFKISRPNDVNICCAISDKDKKIKFFENSKINQQNSILTYGKESKKIKEINSYKLNTILKKNKIAKFDYLNIDVEGAEIQVLNGLDIKKYKPKLITLEINNFLNALDSKTSINNHLLKNNYFLFNRVGVTNFYFHKEFMKKIDKLIQVK